LFLVGQGHIVSGDDEKGDDMADRCELDQPETAEFTVHLSDIRILCNPLDGQEWGCDPIDPAAVIDAAEHLEFETDDWQTVNQKNRGRTFDDYKFHIGRMAFLYANPDGTPIEIELERFENKTRLRVYDGNHRLGSAIVRADAEIGVSVPVDDVGDFLALMPKAEPATKVKPLGHAAVTP
jgi:hypothetical protein